MLGAFDRYRQYDPCGFLDEAAINAVGVPAHFGNSYRSISECEVDFAPAATPKGINRITASVEQTIGADKSIQIAGHTGTEHPGLRCAISLPIVPLVSEVSVALVYTIHSKQDACAELEAIANASVPHLDPPMPRTPSGRSPLTKAAKLDPCAALGMFVPGHKFQPGNMQMYSCDVSLDKRDSTDSTRQVIDFRYISRKSARGDMMPGSHAVTIDGVPGSQQDDDPSNNNYCTIDAFVGMENPVPGYSDGPLQLIDDIRVSGQHCATLMATAITAVKAYKAG
ncbi:hypothetical protein EV192_1131 [Actinocrispum wychmicini]|uniref:Uncharacterized protein n=2 Tax=Actinocrispum wychmicini TaxID=1213861 RepID=A0A4R2IYM6_9PSEU|nr:hypothetical protein EV192_1131 [Actinocrispum wychmicini]